MPTLHALLVGIDRYQGKPKKLAGACSDASSMYNYLTTHLNIHAGFHLNAKPLYNHKARKQDVINAFSIFKQAKGEDVCLFYFAGHGSELEFPPDELSHLARATGKLETIICHDSRSNGGADLTDQEIAHLIGTTVKNIHFSGNGHFVAIMDCCHAGHGTRQEEDGELASRSVKSRYSQPVGAFYGYTGRGPYPVTGNHVQLAACSHRQDAHDPKYTPVLINELVRNGAARSYSQIHEVVKRKVHNDTINGLLQTPDIYAKPGRLAEYPFLGGAVG